MFGYLRAFSLVSLIAVLLIAGMVGIYFRSLASKDLKSMAERGNSVVIDSFGATIWQEHRKKILANAGISAAAPDAELIREAKTFFSQLSVDWVILYDMAGNVLYASLPSPQTSIEINREIAELRNAKNHVTSETITLTADKIPAMAPASLKAETHLVRSLVAMNGPQGQEAYAEIFTGVTTQWHRLLLLQWVASGSIITVFFILIWILLLTSRKAEEIIARQHEANLELAEEAASARAETQQKSLFLANISHELRTPLNAIIGFSEIIKGQVMGEDPAAYQGYITDIHNSGVHLLSLINDILDFSKAEAGKLELEISEVNANKMIANCMRLVLPRAESAGVTLTDSLPKEPVVLSTDSKKFKQVMLNLLSNAVKFTPQGGEVKISAWVNITEDSLSFEVKDTGIGIAPKDISRAMAPFGQVDNALSRKYEGTGLGLPLTKKFVELMGGKFMITSDIGKGTTIQFTLPREFRATGEVPVKILN